MTAKDMAKTYDVIIIGSGPNGLATAAYLSKAGERVLLLEKRHEADRAARKKAGVANYPLDERFLAALTSGMPPAAGIALGLDRLVAVLLGQDSLDSITAFP